MDRSIPDPQTEPTLPVARVAAILGVSKAHVYAQIKADRIPSLPVGGRIVVPTAAFLAQNKLLLTPAA